MSGRIYTCQFALTAITTAVDLFEITPADDKPCEIVGIFISQNTDFGDAQDEILIYDIVRGHTTSGTGGTQAATPVPVKRGDAAAGFTYDTLNTTAASAGTTKIVHSDGFNVRVGQSFWFPEDCEPDASQADTTLLVRLKAAPADSITVTGTLWVREFG